MLTRKPDACGVSHSFNCDEISPRCSYPRNFRNYLFLCNDTNAVPSQDAILADPTFLVHLFMAFQFHDRSKRNSEASRWPFSGPPARVYLW